MKFLKLEINTKKKKTVYLYQWKMLKNIFSEGKEVILEEMNQKVVAFLKNGKANEIVDGTKSNIAIGYAGSNFYITIDDESPEFESNGIKVSIEKYRLVK